MISVNLNYVLPELSFFERRFRIKTKIEQDLLRKSIFEISSYADPKYAFLKVDFEFSKNIKLKSQNLNALLAGSGDTFIVICTIGSKYEKLLRNMEKEIHYVLYLDRLASDIVENTASYSQNAIFGKYYDSNNYKMTKRYSPGYGDFDLNNQELIFKYFNDKNKVIDDVFLNDKNIMIPEKSISYIFGVECLDK